MIETSSFWYLVSFFLFIALGFNPLKRWYKEDFERRQGALKQALEEAHHLKEMSELAFSKTKRRQEEINQEVQSILQHANWEVAHLKEKTTLEIKSFQNKSEKKFQERLAHMKRANWYLFQKRAVEKALNLVQRQTPQHDSFLLEPTSIKKKIRSWNLEKSPVN